MTGVRVVSIVVVSALLSVVLPALANSDEMRRPLSAEYRDVRRGYANAHSRHATRPF